MMRNDVRIDLTYEVARIKELVLFVPGQVAQVNESKLTELYEHPDRLAVFGIEYALEMIQKKATPLDRETPVDLITVEQKK